MVSAKATASPDPRASALLGFESCLRVDRRGAPSRYQARESSRSDQREDHEPVDGEVRHRDAEQQAFQESSRREGDRRAEDESRSDEACGLRHDDADQVLAVGAKRGPDPQLAAPLCDAKREVAVEPQRRPRAALGDRMP